CTSGGSLSGGPGPSQGDGGIDQPPPPPPPPPPAVYPKDRPAGYTNPIPAENARAGDPGWRIRAGDGAPGSAFAARNRSVHVEAYADRTSAVAGETLQVM